MGKMQRNKGKVGERECARVLTALTGRKIERALGAERDGGCDLTGLPEKFAPEVKRHKVRAYPSWQRQAEENAEAGKFPVIFYRLDKTVQWSARCRLNDILAGMGLFGWVDDDVWITLSMIDWVHVHDLQRDA